MTIAEQCGYANLISTNIWPHPIFNTFYMVIEAFEYIEY